MFFITQMIGLAVINAYASTDKELPYGTQPPEGLEMDPISLIINVVIFFAIAILLFYFLAKRKFVLLMRLWFFAVVILAVGITISSLLLNTPLYKLGLFPGTIFQIRLSSLVAGLIAFILAFYKVFRRNILIHNLSELLVYPGIGAFFVLFFVQVLKGFEVLVMIVFLLLISAYDIWAVWKSGFMQKLAKFQMDHMKVFSGFFVPYLSKTQRKKIKLLRQQAKSQKISKKEKGKLKDKKMKVNLAILGGGDIVLPIVTAGVILINFGFLKAIIVSIFATLALAYLLLASQKGKFYPAMPYITTGLLIGIGLAYLIP